MATENKFQANLIKELRKTFRGCLVVKLDANYIQGIPDLLILYKDRWAALECKISKKASVRPNLKYYVDLLDNMSFARFIFPENKKEVLHELQRSLKVSRTARVSKRK